MVLDVIIVAGVLLSALRSAPRGTMAAVVSTLGVSIAAAAAKYLSRPSARWITTGIEWSYNYAIGLTFLIEFTLLLLVLSFILGPTIQRATQSADGTRLDQFVGTLVGGIRGMILVYCLVGAIMLCTQRWGSRRPSFSIQYQKSVVGRWIMTHNLVNPEPYPHAYVLRGVLGYETGIHDTSETALGVLRAHPMTEFLRADQAVKAAIWNKDWRSLHQHKALLALTTNPEFLYFAKAATTPKNQAKDETPEERFRELKQR